MFWRYQIVRTLVDFGAAACFVIGSAFFFFADLTIQADWLFLVGSILFALKPTIDVVRSAHLNKLPHDLHDLAEDADDAVEPHTKGAEARR